MKLEEGLFDIFKKRTVNKEEAQEIRKKDIEDEDILYRRNLRKTVDKYGQLYPKEEIKENDSIQIQRLKRQKLYFNLVIESIATHRTIIENCQEEIDFLRYCMETADEDTKSKFIEVIKEKKNEIKKEESLISKDETHIYLMKTAISRYEDVEDNEENPFSYEKKEKVKKPEEPNYGRFRRNVLNTRQNFKKGIQKGAERTQGYIKR